MSEYRVPDFHQLTPATEIQSRIDRAHASIAEQDLDALLIVYLVDLYYLTGTAQDCHLLLPVKGPPLLMVRRELSRAKAESAIDDVVGLKEFGNLVTLVNNRLGAPPRRLGLELDVLPVDRFRRYQSLWPSTEMVGATPIIMGLRSVKSEFEVSWMRRAGDLARKVYTQVPRLLRPGLTEIELADLMTREAYPGGHQNYLRTRVFNQEVFSWHVISGESGGVVSSINAPFGGYGLSPSFPVGASRKVIRPGEPVLIDFGFCLDGYHVDLTRMFSIGPSPSIVKDAYQALGLIEAELLQNLQPGILCGSLFERAKNKAEQLGFGEAFLGAPGFKVRFAGHGVGLELSEPPFLSQSSDATLQEGMTVALELKMVFPGIGAVGLENTILVKETGPEKLTLADEEYIEV